MAQRTRGLRAVLGLPAAYLLLMRLLGAQRSRAELVTRYMRLRPGMRILDVGCGPARILDYFPMDADYVGVDLSPAYIEAARKRYKERATFLCSELSEFDVSRHGPFDLVLALGVLHHLDDEAVRYLFRNARSCLADGGRCLTVDPAYVDDQPRIARALARIDRGANVRTPAEYRRLAETAFDTVRSEIRHDRLRIPYTHHLMEVSLYS